MASHSVSQAVLCLKASMRLRWLILAFVPSSLLLSVTTYLTTDIAPIPLLWVIPLALYLLSFVLTFGGSRRRNVAESTHKIILRWMPIVALVLAVVILREATEPLLLVVGLHLFGFFWLAMQCHGELARIRPGPEQLTEFYFWLALGGALGGFFNALLAPLLFSSLAEYPVMIVLACLVRPQIARPIQIPPTYTLVLALFILLLGLLSERVAPGWDPAAVFALPLILIYLLHTRPVSFGFSLALVFAASSLLPGIHGTILWRQRSFFGVHRVTEQNGFRKLFHGHTLHGQQSLHPGERNEPLTYYHRTGPIGQVMTSMLGDRRLQRVGLVGLGTGALAGYAAPGASWTFFEIDPAVIHIAAPETGLFSYLKDSKGKIDIVQGDGRLSLSKSNEQFGLLVIDAFGSDAIPLHLLTREALGVYRARLQEQGILAFHISNRYVDLEPVLANLAQDARPSMVCTIQRDVYVDEESLKKGKSASVWMLLANSAKDLPPQASPARWKPARAKSNLAPWTDDYSDLLSVLDWFGSKQ